MELPQAFLLGSHEGFALDPQGAITAPPPTSKKKPSWNQSPQKISWYHGKAGAPSSYLELLGKLCLPNNWISRTVGSSLATSLEPLAHCWNVASLSLFNRYCLVLWSGAILISGAISIKYKFYNCDCSNYKNYKIKWPLFLWCTNWSHLNCL